MQKSKECIIDNAPLGWVLKADGKELYFQGAYVVEWLEEKFEELGYTVKLTESWKERANGAR